MSPILSSNTTNSTPSTPVTGPIIFRTILQNPTLAFFSIHQLLLTVNLIFYKRNKAVLGFLDEEEMGIKYVHNRLWTQHSTMEKKIRKRWGEEAWAQWWKESRGGKTGVCGCMHLRPCPFPTTECKHSLHCNNLFIPPPNSEFWQTKEKCCMPHCFHIACLAQCSAIGGS